MARITRVAKSRKEHTCGKGGHVIPKGSPYMHATPGFRGRTLYRCFEHPFRGSDLATGLNADALRAQEDFDDTIGSLEEYDYEGLNGAISEFREALEEYVSIREEGLSAWENGNSTLEELRDDAQAALDEIEGLEEHEDLEEPERSQFDSDEEFEQAKDDWETERQEHWENAISEAETASSNVSL